MGDQIQPDKPDSWSEGDLMETKPGEQIIVLDKQGDLLTVSRAENDTEMVTIDSANKTVVYQNPRFTGAAIDFGIDTIMNELERKGVHIFETAVFEPDALPPDMTGLLEVIALYYYYENGEICPLPAKQINEYAGDVDRVSPIRKRFGQNRTYYMTYKKKITEPEDLLPRQVGIVPIGVAAELLTGQIIPSLTDPGRRADRTIPPGQEGRDVSALASTYERRVREEAQLLKQESKRVPGNTSTEFFRRRNP